MRIGILVGVLCAMHMMGWNSVAFAAPPVHLPSLIPQSGCLDSDGNEVSCTTPTTVGCNFKTGVLDSRCAPVYIAYVIKIIFELTGAIFLLMIIIGGYQYVLSKAGGGGGDEGKARVRFAIIGFLVTALSFYIVDFVLSSMIP